MATWNPDDYRKNSSQQQKWARELIAKLKLNGDENVLDLGCGDGKITAELAAIVPQGSVIGLDYSVEMTNFAHRTFTRSEHPNLSFVHGDASRLSFCDQFDVIFSNAVLHWIYDHQPVLAGICRALRPGGRILVQMGGRRCAADVLDVVGQMMSEPRWRSCFEGFAFRYGFHGPEEYRHWLVRAGLTSVRVELIHKDMVHAGSKGMAGWVRTTWIPYTQRVPENQREQFIDEIVDRYLGVRPLDADGNAHVKMMRLEVEATRPVRLVSG